MQWYDFAWMALAFDRKTGNMTEEINRIIDFPRIGWEINASSTYLGSSSWEEALSWEELRIEKGSISNLGLDEAHPPGFDDFWRAKKKWPTLRAVSSVFPRLPDVQNTIFRCPNAIGYASECAIFGALGPRLHGFFGLFLKRPSFAHNFAFAAPFFFIFSESLGKDVENISAKGFKKLSTRSWDRPALRCFFVNGKRRYQNA